MPVLSRIALRKFISFSATVERILFRPPRAASHAADRSLRRLSLSPRRLCIASTRVLMTQRILYLNVDMLLFAQRLVKGVFETFCVFHTNIYQFRSIFGAKPRILVESASTCIYEKRRGHLLVFVQHSCAAPAKASASDAAPAPHAFTATSGSGTVPCPR